MPSPHEAQASCLREKKSLGRSPPRRPGDQSAPGSRLGKEGGRDMTEEQVAALIKQAEILAEHAGTQVALGYAIVSVGLIIALLLALSLFLWRRAASVRIESPAQEVGTQQRSAPGRSAKQSTWRATSPRGGQRGFWSKGTRTRGCKG